MRVGKRFVENENFVTMQDFNDASSFCLVDIITRGCYHNLFSLLREKSSAKYKNNFKNRFIFLNNYSKF